MSKISFRFYKDHEVRAVWDEENSKWWFSVQDVVGAINDQSEMKKHYLCAGCNNKVKLWLKSTNSDISGWTRG